MRRPPGSRTSRWRRASRQACRPAEDTDMAKTYHGAYASFDTPAALYHAAEEVTKAGYTRTDAHTPFPVHGIDVALRHGPSHVGWLAAGMGFLGIVLGQLMMQWMN